ncbi:hypothetical protein N431DRAFT_141622 [Stipitochalara longipes BDJ]|nr:hypothetical protein N431DRAFT_141622 [Stipitochalara longipes BDJ]
MGDPLSITASIIAVATVALQSTKFIYETVSSLRDGGKEFRQADQALQSLCDILAQVQGLARQQSGSSGSISHGSDSSSNSEAFFKELEITVKNCGDDLKPLVDEVERWKAAKTGENKVASALKRYIKRSDLRKILKVVSRQIQVLNVHLSIAGCTQMAEQANAIGTSKTEISGLLDELTMELKTSTTEVKSHLSRRLDQVETISGRNVTDFTARLDASARDSTIQHEQVQESIKVLAQGLSTQFNSQSKLLEEMMREIQRQFQSVNESKRMVELGEHVQDCIDRLYDLKNSVKGDLDVDSEEAQLIAEDVVSILKALLHEASFLHPHEMNRKRKLGVMEDEDPAESESRIKQGRMIKKMRGILDSSQTIQIRQSSC